MCSHVRIRDIHILIIIVLDDTSCARIFFNMDVKWLVWSILDSESFVIRVKISGIVPSITFVDDSLYQWIP